MAMSRSPPAAGGGFYEGKQHGPSYSGLPAGLKMPPDNFVRSTVVMRFWAETAWLRRLPPLKVSRQQQQRQLPSEHFAEGKRDQETGDRDQPGEVMRFFESFRNHGVDEHGENRAGRYRRGGGDDRV